MTREDAEAWRLPIARGPATLLGAYASRTRDGSRYVVWEQNGLISCSCPGFAYAGHCWHADHERETRDMAELVEKLEEQTLVRLPSYQRKWLRERRHHEGVSHADSVRQALDMLIEAEARRAERRAKSNGD